MAAAQATAAATAAPAEARKLFVGGVPSAATEADLIEYFARFGEVRSAMVMRDRETGHCRGFAFVEFEAEDAAARALGDGDQPRHYICGRQVGFELPSICASSLAARSRACDALLFFYEAGRLRMGLLLCCLICYLIPVHRNACVN
jgi:hypothetical protein